MAEPTNAAAASTTLSQPVAQATWYEKLDLIPGLLSILGTAFYHAVSGPFRGQSGAYTYQQHVTHALARKLAMRFNTAQLQYIGTPFSKVYEQWCQENKVTPIIVTSKSGVKGFWIGDPNSEYTVVYFHGGGFAMDGGPEHLAFWGSDVYPDVKAAGKSVAFFFLEYTLTPHASYPTQIREAVEAVEYVTTDLKKSASKIMLGGDSAGGNMCLAVLSHVMHPIPDLPPLKIDMPFKAFFLVAPWVAFEAKWPSAKNNKYKDIVTEYAANLWSGSYLNKQATSPYAEALNAESSWWKNPQVEHIVCVAGADELLVDPISEWVEKYKSTNGPESITYVVGQHEIHIAPIIEPMLGDKTPTAQGEAIKSWMKARL